MLERGPRIRVFEGGVIQSGWRPIEAILGHHENPSFPRERESSLLDLRGPRLRGDDDLGFFEVPYSGHALVGHLEPMMLPISNRSRLGFSAKACFRRNMSEIRMIQVRQEIDLAQDRGAAPEPCWRATCYSWGRPMR